MTDHKEISPKLRALLSSLDDERLTKTGKVDLSKQVTLKALDTKKEPSLRQKNLQVLVKRTMTRAEREEEAQRLAEAARPIFPDARVLFILNTKCRACGKEQESVSHPHVFVRLRRLTTGGVFHPTDFRFIPERELETPIQGKLAKLILHHNQEVDSCLRCFKNAVHLYSGQNIESLAPITPSTLDETSSSLTSPMQQLSGVQDVASGILKSSSKTPSLEKITDSGQPLISASASDGKEQLTTAHVQHTITHIGVIEEAALREAERREEAMGQEILSSQNDLSDLLG